MQTNKKLAPWQNKSFPLFDDMDYLIHGTVATGKGAFRPGTWQAGPSIQDVIDPVLLEELDDNDDDDDDKVRDRHPSMQSNS